MADVIHENVWEKNTCTYTRHQGHPSSGTRPPSTFRAKVNHRESDSGGFVQQPVPSSPLELESLNTSTGQ